MSINLEILIYGRKISAKVSVYKTNRKINNLVIKKTSNIYAKKI